MSTRSLNKQTLIEKMEAKAHGCYGASKELFLEDAIAIVREHMGDNLPYEIAIQNSDKVALIDHEDNALETFKWHLDSHGYPRRRTTAEWIYMHNDVIGKRDGFLVDHINRNPLDNRRSNLRFVTRGQNVVNSEKQKGDYTSKHKGVSWDKERSKWVASIKYNGLRKNLGRFETEINAALAYNKSASEHFGDSAFLNTVSNNGVDGGGADADTRKDSGSADTLLSTSPATPSQDAEVVAEAISREWLRYEPCLPITRQIAFNMAKAAIAAYEGKNNAQD